LITVVENETAWGALAVGVSTEPALTTTYVYDTLDDLHTVTQGVQTRTFSYDSLKRLVQGINPENGTIGYSYDDSGNLTSRQFQQSTQITVSTPSYDGMNRPLSKSYSGGSITTPPGNVLLRWLCVGPEGPDLRRRCDGHRAGVGTADGHWQQRVHDQFHELQ